MTMHRLPVPSTSPLHCWGSSEIATFTRAAVNRPTLPAPGNNARRLIQESTGPMPPTTEATLTDWTGTTMCNHRRDAAMQTGVPAIGLADLEPNHRRILRLLSTLDTRPQPCGTLLRMCVNRRRLKASAETMQDLHRAGLVNGAGSRDPFGTGNTPDSSWWWLSTAGMQIARLIGMAEAGNG